MNILITNDDGYKAKGLDSLVKVLERFGKLTIVAPKEGQSGMSMAVTMGLKPIAVKHLEPRNGQDWWYLDGTPASCVKFGIDNVMTDCRPDIVFSGINHGANYATAALYSGTVGAAMEGAVNGIPSVAISLDDFSHDADFSAMEELLPGILEKLIPNISRKFGIFYNINFPNLSAAEIKGVKVASMGFGHWEDEYNDYSKDFFKSFGLPLDRYDDSAHANTEPGEKLYVMAGNFVENAHQSSVPDHRYVGQGYVTVSIHNIDNSDIKEIENLCAII